MYSKSFTKPRHLKEFDCFTDIGATIADNFNVEMPKYGRSALEKLK